tara:strand:- start:811 stop:1215 length:405 start_codon:yes stop_codon:yes gene_type:complete
MVIQYNDCGYGSEYTAYFPVKAVSALPASGGDPIKSQFATTYNWSPVTADIRVIKDGGSPAALAGFSTSGTKNPVSIEEGGTETGVWSITLSADEMTAECVVVVISDATATPVIDDLCLILNTRSSRWVCVHNS